MHSAVSRPDGNGKSRTDRAGEKYWEQVWKDQPLPPAIDPHAPGLNNYRSRQIHKFFAELFAPFPTRGKKLVEIGCAQSTFLPYFSKYFGFEVHGLDRSPGGCDKSRMILDREKVAGVIYCADLFSPTSELLSKFDIAVSFGVVEHFENTAGALKAIAGLLKPGGMMVTEIPNLVGILGSLEKVLDRSVYDIHVPLDREALASAHREAGLEVETCEYFLRVDLGILNIERWPKNLAYRIVSALQIRISKLFWLVEDWIPFVRPNRWTSPYTICVARKPTD